MSAFRSLTTLALFILIQASGISAAGSTTFIFPKGILNIWTFIAYIFLVVTTLAQASLALDMLRKGRPLEEDFQRRSLFTTIILFGILSLLAAYALDGLLWSKETHTINLQSLDFPSMYVMMDFTRAFAHILIYGALLLLLDYRIHVPRLQSYIFYEPKQTQSRTMTSATTFRLVSIILLLIMLAAAAASAGVGSRHSIVLYPPAAIRLSHPALYHLFLASYILTTALICVTSNIILVNRLAWELTEEVDLFDEYVLWRIARNICYILCIRAVYELIRDILLSGPHSGSINLSAFNLADILITGLTYASVCKTALGLGIQPKRWYWVFYYI